MELGFKVLGARLLVERYKEVEVTEVKTTLGIIIPSTQDENIEFKRRSGKVLSFGTGVSSDVLDNISTGQVISFKDPHEVKYNGVDYYVVHENNIELIID